MFKLFMFQSAQENYLLAKNQAWKRKLSDVL